MNLLVIERWLSFYVGPLVLTLVLVIFPEKSQAARMLHLLDKGAASQNEEGVDLAGEYYGIDVDRIYVRDSRQSQEIKELLRHNKYEGIVLTVQVGAVSENLDILSLLDHTINDQTNVFIENIRPDISLASLNYWSKGAIRLCREVPGSYRTRISNDGSLREIVRQLAGIEYPHSSSGGCTFEGDGPFKSLVLLSAHSDFRNEPMPVLVVCERNRQRIFLVSEAHLEMTGQVRSEQVKTAIWEKVPLLMFMAYSAGNAAWHPPSYYANFTIDDPWLRDPYGDLSYHDLLGEMAQANFHTTIAFIPWNYERSEKTVVELMQNNPERFSIAIHGNDHDHRDFSLSQADEWYDNNIKQAIWRMEEFRNSTKIPYDKIMIFPRGIVPRSTFKYLKQQDFLATINGSNVPTGEPKPEDLLYYMRPGTTRYDNLLNLSRHFIGDLSRADIALEIFLGNPILFYAHHDLFEAGTDAFNKFAIWVNEIEPEVKWANLGEVVKHYYLMKKQDERTYRVIMWSSQILLENRGPYPIRFILQKSEDRLIRNTGGTCGQQSVEWSSNDGMYHATLTLDSQSSCELRIEYERVQQTYYDGVEKSKVSALIIRGLSDFRDIVLLKMPGGRKLVSSIYILQSTVSAESVVIIALALGLSIAAVSWKFLAQKAIRRRKREG